MVSGGGRDEWRMIDRRNCDTYRAIVALALEVPVTVGAVVLPMALFGHVLVDGFLGSVLVVAGLAVEVIGPVVLGVHVLVDLMLGDEATGTGVAFVHDVESFAVALGLWVLISGQYGGTRERVWERVSESGGREKGR